MENRMIPWETEDRLYLDLWLYIEMYLFIKTNMLPLHQATNLLFCLLHF